jgi:hypothetical protein
LGRHHRAAQEALYPTDKAWLREEAFLWDLTAAIRDVVQSGELPEDHPVSVALNRQAQRLRQITRRDPMIRDLGVELPTKFEDHILRQRTERAFIFPAQPTDCYHTTGIIRILPDLLLQTAIIAHEQAHLIFVQLMQKQKEKNERTQERYGEPLWHNPLHKAWQEAKPQEYAYPKSA